MKTIFVEARKKLKLNKEKLGEIEKQLPDTIYIAYTIQYKELAEQIKKELKNQKNKEILGISQILGCSDIKTKAKAILLIGEARFHALNLALSSQKPVFIFDNFSINKINKEEIEKINKQEKGRYLRFLSSQKIGILVSLKSGQNKLNLSENIKKELEKQGKKVYLFLADNINISELENFPDVECWINTACPGLALDSQKTMNYSSIKTKNSKNIIYSAL